MAPEALLPEEAEFRGAQRFTRIEDGIAGADVVMMLRIQKERMAQSRVARRRRLLPGFWPGRRSA